MKQKNGSIYEFSARRIKADKLADTIQGAGGTSSEAAKMGDQDWAMVEFLTGVKPASAETKRMAVEILGGRENACEKLRPVESHSAAA
jgi:hypothetical protein